MATWILREWRLCMVVLVPLALLPLILVSQSQEGQCGYVAILMALFWSMELLPLGVTALMPIVLLPLFGIMSSAEVTPYYMKDTIMLFFGGLIVAIAVEETNLHRRIALTALNTFGASPRCLLLGFMVPTAFLSMWISNTATSAMMVPIMEAVIKEIETGVALGPKAHESLEPGSDPGSPPKPPSALKNMRPMLAMAICFSANVGGTATTIGTAPNLIMLEMVKGLYPNASISFTSWMALGVPQLIVFLVLIWVWLQLYYLPFPWAKSQKVIKEESLRHQAEIRALLRKNLDDLGPVSYKELNVICLFVILVGLWFAKDPGFVQGWLEPMMALNGGKVISDSSVVILVVLVLFVLPDRPLFCRGQGKYDLDHRPSQKILSWKVIQSKLPWDVLLLFGGGFALAGGIKKSGLSTWLGGGLSSLGYLDSWMLQIVICLLTSAMTQVSSNSATANIILPIALELAREQRVNPIYFTLPPTLICSLTFILPFSTAPNSITFNVSGMSVLDMVKVGWLLNILTLGITLLFVNSLGYLIFDLGNYPDWTTVPAVNLTAG